MASEIEVHFNRRGPGGQSFVVVAIGTDVYGAVDPEPGAALGAAATSASEDLARRGRPVDREQIMARGLKCLPPLTHRD